MSERFTVLFLCGRCGLTTAGAAMLPEFVNPDRPILVEHVCRHCDHAVGRPALIHGRKERSGNERRDPAR